MTHAFSYGLSLRSVFGSALCVPTQRVDIIAAEQVDAFKDCVKTSRDPNVVANHDVTPRSRVTVIQAAGHVEHVSEWEGRNPVRPMSTPPV